MEIPYIEHPKKPSLFIDLILYFLGTHPLVFCMPVFHGIFYGYKTQYNHPTPRYPSKHIKNIVINYEVLALITPEALNADIICGSAFAIHRYCNTQIF
jgi:hypothetical protein